MNYSDINSDLKPNEDPDEIFRAITEGKLTQPHQVLQVTAALRDNLYDFQVMKRRWTDWRCSLRAIPEWMSADGSRCTKLRCKRIKRSWRLSSQVIRNTSASADPIRS